MSFTTKLTLPFVLLALIAAGLGLLGWRAITTLTDELDEVIGYEMAAVEKLSQIGRSFEAITVVQRTLLNVTIPITERAASYGDYARENAVLQSELQSMDDLFTGGVARVTGWDALREKWRAAAAAIGKWRELNDQEIGKHREWEASTIINPDALLKNLGIYRGDHYALVARLGAMIARGGASGNPIAAADDTCNFGRWRVNFDSGAEPYSGNAAFRAAMEQLREPHRRFHQTSHDVYQMMEGGTAATEGREAIFAPFLKAIEAAGEVIAGFDALTAEAEKSRKMYENLAVVSMGELDALRNAARDRLGEVLSLNKELAAANTLAVKKSSRTAAAGMWTMTIVALVLASLLAVVVRTTVNRRVIRPLKGAILSLIGESGAMAESIAGVSAASKSFALGIQNQAASLEEIEASFKGIAEHTRKTVQELHNADDMMGENAVTIEEGSRAMETMNEAMSGIKDSSDKISRILEAMESIAFQTNLLALNAAVEAARAGEAGKGFAVVADEVRNLAQRSAQAARESAGLIQTTEERVTRGVEVTETIRRQFSHIASVAEKTKTLMETIRAASEEELESMTAIETSVAEIDRVAQENSQTAEQTSLDSGRLAENSRGVVRVTDSMEDILGRLLGRRAAKALAGDPSSDVPPPFSRGQTRIRTQTRTLDHASPGTSRRALPPPRKA